MLFPKEAKLIYLAIEEFFRFWILLVDDNNWFLEVASKYYSMCVQDTNSFSNQTCNYHKKKDNILEKFQDKLIFNAHISR